MKKKVTILLLSLLFAFLLAISNSAAFTLFVIVAFGLVCFVILDDG